MSYASGFGGGGGAGTVISLTGNSGGAVNPTAGNINIVGSGATTVVGNPGLSTLTITNTPPTITGNTGGAVSPTTNNYTLVGAGSITVTGNPGTSTLTITGGNSFTWNNVTSATQAIVVNNGYISNRAGLITYSLPATSAVGDVFEITNINTALGWTVTQAAGQSIRLGNALTTVGVGGSLSSLALGDSIRCVCVVANTTWVVTSVVGNITIV